MGRNLATVVMLVLNNGRATILSNLSLENLAVGMVIRTVLPPLYSSTIDMRW
jgi:hypothetical protein